MLRKLKMVLAGILAGVFVMGSILPGGAFRGGAGVAKAAEGEPVHIGEENFPDPKFMAVIAGPEYDRNLDGYLDADEIALTINIYCEGKGIHSLAGVEYFTALEGLWCKDNQISSLNLSKNKELHGVWCSGNPLTSLDFSDNPKLEWVYCYDCQLTSLNVSNNPMMAFIECNTNPLTELNVSNNPLLEHLTCGTCKLTQLILTNNPNLSHLDAFRNQLTSLDVSNNKKLKRLDIWDNHSLGSVDISQNTGLQYYNCANNGATSVNTSNNPELTKLICSYNSITSLNLSNNPKLVYLDCAQNSLSSLDISRNTKLYFLQAFTNPFTSLDIRNNPSLVKTYETGKKKDESGVGRAHSWTLDYGGDTSTGGDNIYFLCVDDKVNVISAAKDPTPTPTKAASGNTGNGVTREKAAQKLYEMAGSPGVSGLKSRFTDVVPGASYEPALLWGEKNSICVGTPDIASDTFGVGEEITIQDLLLMLMRYSEYRGYKRSIDFGRSDDFSDYYDVDYYAWEAVCWAATWGIYDGKGDPNAPKEKRRIDPHAKATRAEFDSMVSRMLAINGGGSIPTSAPTPTAVPTSAPTSVPSVTKAASPSPVPTTKPENATPSPTSAAVSVTGEPTPSAEPEVTISGTITGTISVTGTVAPEPTGTPALTDLPVPDGATETPTPAEETYVVIMPSPEATLTSSPLPAPTTVPDEAGAGSNTLLYLTLALLAVIVATTVVVVVKP